MVYDFSVYLFHIFCYFFLDIWYLIMLSDIIFLRFHFPLVVSIFVFFLLWMRLNIFSYIILKGILIFSVSSISIFVEALQILGILIFILYIAFSQFAINISLCLWGFKFFTHMIVFKVLSFEATVMSSH